MSAPLLRLLAGRFGAAAAFTATRRPDTSAFTLLSARSFHVSRTARFAIFSGSKDEAAPSRSTRSETRVLRVREGEATPAEVTSSTGDRSPCALYHDMSDEEYFDPTRPLRWLVAMDFSVNAWRALRGAKQLMNRERSDALVVFSVPVVPLIDVGDDTTFYHGTEVVREAIDACVRQMEAVHEECRDLMGHYSCEVSEPASDPRELILMRLERKGEERIDYAVCGQRGRSRLLNIILGSVAIHLAHYAPTSVVIVK